jgi:hypothetical protein
LLVLLLKREGGGPVDGEKEDVESRELLHFQM